jgi:hypothetical protein
MMAARPVGERSQPSAIELCNPRTSPVSVKPRPTLLDEGYHGGRAASGKQPHHVRASPTGTGESVGSARPAELDPPSSFPTTACMRGLAAQGFWRATSRTFGRRLWCVGIRPVTTPATSRACAPAARRRHR